MSILDCLASFACFISSSEIKLTLGNKWSCWKFQANKEFLSSLDSTINIAYPSKPHHYFGLQNTSSCRKWIWKKNDKVMIKRNFFFVSTETSQFTKLFEKRPKLKWLLIKRQKVGVLWREMLKRSFHRCQLF